jgi:hypothetical protein
MSLSQPRSAAPPALPFLPFLSFLSFLAFLSFLPFLPQISIYAAPASDYRARLFFPA